MAAADSNCPQYGPIPEPQQARQSLWKNLKELAHGIILGAESFEDPAKAHEFAGWGLDIINGSHSDESSQSELEQQRIELNENRETLQYICQTMEKTEQEVREVIDNQHWQLYQQQLDKVRDVKVNVQTVTDQLHDQMAATIGTPLDPAQVRTWRTTAVTNLNALQEYIYGTSEGSYLLPLYRQVVEDFLRNKGLPLPSETGVYTTEFLHPIYDQVAYYMALMTANMRVLAEVYHVVLPGENAADNGATANSYITRSQNLMQEWVQYAAPTQRDIPDGTAVDTRTSPFTMWTSSPVGLNGQSPTTVCRTATAFCFENLYTSDHRIMNSRLVRPVTAPIPPVGDLPDWQIPTAAQFNSLVNGATGGVDARLRGLGLPGLASRQVTSHLAGLDRPVSVVGPFLVEGEDPTSSSVVHWASQDPDSAAQAFSTTSMPPGQNSLAGYLVLVRDFAVDQLIGGAPEEAANAAEPETIGAAAFVPANVPSASLGQPVYFTDATMCSDGTTYTVPADATAVKVVTVGAVGGAGRLNKQQSAAGGFGGEVTTIVPTQPGAVLHVQVGSAGADTTGGVGGGGRGGDTVQTVGGDVGNHSGGGGGASGVSTDPTCSLWLAVGAGGGGGGSGYSHQPLVNAAVPGGRGGDACPDLKSCGKPGDGQPLPNQTNSHPGGAGTPPPQNDPRSNNTGGSLPGQAGATMAGGRGSDGLRNVAGYSGGGAGGGGGAGFYGGGSGGGGGWIGSGGGGAGGANFAIDAYGLNAVQTNVASEGQLSLVVITPLRNTGIQAPMTLTASQTTLGLGEDLTLTVQMPADVTGQIGFYDSSLPGPDKGIGLADLRDGKAVLSLAEFSRPFGMGVHTLSASFGGDAIYSANDTPAVTVTVERRSPKITLTASKNVLAINDAITLTASLDPTQTTGTVDFIDTDAPSNNLIGSATVVNGVATLHQDATTMKPGNHHLVAQYNGDDLYAAATSPKILINVGTGAVQPPTSPSPTPLSPTITTTSPTSPVASPGTPTISTTHINSTPTTGKPLASATRPTALAHTGAGPTTTMLITGLMMLLIGGLLTLTRRRRQRG
ncbi:Glycine rich protein (plasmid) [Variovorax sp. PBS-H4]|uniref:Ig-like domain-containing protein n=1 Tax=Variovorax sp. PBS-H4 TaxID=434008 RepID=UPI0013198EAC|nr:Ig-like domain-containing protein [Variovorax sp. PBS-H4]VTU41439.1 Glycine rich protein [Variovorax sp. PBS-H4]